MAEEITGINREAVCEILVNDLGKKKRALILFRFVNTRLKTAIEFVEIFDVNRNVLKMIVMDDESWFFVHNAET
jgi:hypothetical protein